MTRRETWRMQLISLGMLFRYKTESELLKVTLLLQRNSHRCRTLIRYKVISLKIHSDLSPCDQSWLQIKDNHLFQSTHMALTSHMFLVSSNTSSWLAVGCSLMLLQQGGHLSGFRSVLKHHVHAVYRRTWTLVGPPFAVVSFHLYFL